MPKNRPDWRVQSRAMAYRRSVLSVIVFSANVEDPWVNSGSGFVIKRDDHAQHSIVLTSWHTLRKNKPGDILRVRSMDSEGVQELPADVIYQNMHMDVAILRVPGLTSLPPLRFAPDCFPGQSIIAIGYCDPYSLDPDNQDSLFYGTNFTRIPATSPGRVSPEGTCLVSINEGLTLNHVNLDCVTMHGMSGGPVVSSRGVIAMTDSGERGLTNAVSRGSILQVLKDSLGLYPHDNVPMESVIDQLI